MKTSETPTRADILARARALRQEIAEIFADYQHWNDNSPSRAEGAEPIDPDPDGQLRRIAEGLDRMLEREDARGTESIRGVVEQAKKAVS